MYFNYYFTDLKKVVFEKRRELIYNSNLQVDLVLLGDSITEGFDITKYGITNKVCINVGISGDIITNMNKRFERDVLSLNPKEILFMGGINDIRNWYANINDLNNVTEVNEIIISNLKQIIKKCKEHNIKINICTIIYNQEREKNYIYLNEIIKKVNENIKKIAENEQVQLIDYNKILANENGFFDFNLSRDGLHPNEYGYIRMAKLISNILIK